MVPTEGKVDQEVTVAENEFTRAGYKFTGWNTKADGSGTTYQPGSQYKLTVEDDILYAQWTADFSDLKVDKIDVIYTAEEHSLHVSGTILPTDKILIRTKAANNEQTEWSAWTELSTANSYTNVTDLIAQVKVQRGSEESEPLDTIIKIEPIELTVTADSASKVYDGIQLTCDTFQITYLKGTPVDEHDVKVEVDGSQILVGKSDNVVTEVTVLAGNEPVTDNYNITKVNGILEVTDGTDKEPVDPENVVTKTHDGNEYGPGDTVEFTIQVKNIYDEPKTITITEQPGVTLVNANAEDKIIEENVPAGEIITASATYLVTEEDILSGSFKNTVTVSFNDGKEFKAEDPVDLEEKNGHLTVNKTTTSEPEQNGEYALGETIYYQIEVVNDGNLTITDIDVTDSLSTAEGQIIGHIDSLAPGASQTFDFEYVVDEDDILAGKVHNVATATGSSPDKKEPEVPVTPGTKDDTPEDPDAHITIIKDSISKPKNGETYELGEIIEYKITVTNDGNLTLTNVTVTDELTGGHWEIQGEFKPGASEVFTTSYEVTEEDILHGSVKNVANATGKGPDGHDPVVVPGEKEDATSTENPNLYVEKTATPDADGVYNLGDTIHYTIKVTNNGNVTISNIKVTDDLTGGKWTADSLAPNKSTTFTTSYVVTESDILNGTIKNIAKATGTDPDGNPVETEGTATVTTDTRHPYLTVDKTTTSTPENGSAYALGETIKYRIVVTNTGNVTLKNVTATDELTGNEWPVGTLAPGASEDYTAEYTVTEKDILNGQVVNTATADGEGPDGEEPEKIPDEVTDITVDPNGHISITKTTTSTPESDGKYALGETITYHITAVNDGNLTLTNVVVTDDLTGDNWPISSFAPGDVKEFNVSYTVTEKDVLNGSVLNEATATGESPDPENPNPGVDPGKEEEEVVDPAPALSVEKVAKEGKYDLGDEIPYTIVVTNTGNVTITDIQVTDDLTEENWTIASLAPGEEKELTTQYTVTEADLLAGTIVNTASVSGTDPDGNPVEAEDTATVTPEPTNPHLTIVKVTTSKPENQKNYVLGETIKYEVKVTNDGNLTLTNIAVDDILTEGHWEIESLAPGESTVYETSYVVTEKDILAGQVLNVATATGESPDPEKEPEVVPGDTVDPTDPKKGHITITKESTSTPKNEETYELGETITYKITVTNDGNLTLTNVVVRDELTDSSWTIESLAPGQSKEFTTKYVVTEADVLAGSVLNTATATGESPDPENPDPGVDPGEEEDPTSTPAPSLFVEKEAAEGEYDLGDAIPYTVKVTNNGNVTVKNVVVTDDLTGETWKLDSLAPNTAVTFTTSYTVTEDNILAGEIVNVATAVGKAPDGSEVKDDGTATVKPMESNPIVTITKKTTSTPANGTTYALNETITYQIIAKNDGNLTLTNVVVTDDLTGDQWTIETLLPGAQEEFEASYVVKEKDIHAGTVVNEATAIGETPDPEKPEPDVDPGVTEDPTDPVNEDLNIEKTVTSTPENGEAYAIGETIKYQIKVENAGNVTLHNIVVEDILETADGNGVPVIKDISAENAVVNGTEVTIESIAPGDEVTIICEYTVRKADRDTTVTNRATAASDETPDPESTETPGEDIAEVYDIFVNHAFAEGETGDPTILPADYTFTENQAPGYTATVEAGAVEGYTAFPASRTVEIVDGDITVTFYYYKDEIGTDPENPDTGDGVPDKYQITFNYVAAENGTVNGTLSEVHTIYEFTTNADGTITVKEELKPAHPIADVTLFPATGYAFDYWTVDGSKMDYTEKMENLKKEGYTTDTTFTAYFAEDNGGGGDDGNDPDGTPDKYQIVFRYVSADTTKGIVMGTTFETHTFTDENGNYLEASTVPTSPKADVTVAALSGNAFDYWNVQGQDAKDFTETMDTLKAATYTEDTTFVANFDTDTKGGGDDAEEPDNIPDKYQVIFRYVSADTTMGTVTGEPTALVEVRTLTTPAGGYLEAASNPVSPRAEVTVNAAAGNSFVYWTDGTATDYSASLATIKTMTYSTDTTFTAYFSTNGTITVTKLLTVMDGMDEIPMASTEGLTYHFGLFTDAEGTTLLGEEYVKEVTMQNTSSAQLVFENVPDGTYYVFETDANGNALAYDTAQGSGTDSYVPVLNGPTNAVIIDLAAGTSTGQISVTNRYYMDPGGQYYIDAELNITKNVLDGGKAINPDQTFYAGVFTMNEDGTYQLLEGQVIALSNNGTVTTNVPLGGEYGTDEITYYVFETDAQGNILVSGDEAFGYDITGGGAVTLSQENFRETVEITNTVMDNGEEPNTEEPDTEEPDTEPDTQESTETEKVTDTVKTNSVKTGDDTNIAIYLVVLIMAGYVLVVAKRRRQK